MNGRGKPPDRAKRELRSNEDQLLWILANATLNVLRAGRSTERVRAKLRELLAPNTIAERHSPRGLSKADY